MTGEPTVADAGERELVARIQAKAPPAPAWVRVGIGDDAAVMEPPRRLLEVVTTDALLEHVHFERALVGAGDVGFKALAVNLSDLAAMGALPRAATLSLALPDALPLADFDALVEGLTGLALEQAVALVGGNITRSPGPLVVDVTAFGTVHPRRVLTRGGARPGDGLYVSGLVGGAAAGLAWLRRGAAASGQASPDEPVAAAIACHRRPNPRVRLGVLVGRNRAASACVDLSDGFADAVRQLAASSRAGAVVDAEAVPLHAGTAGAWPDQADPLACALGGGEDYELLFAVPRRARRAFEAIARRPGLPPVSRVGEVVAGRDVVLRRGGREEPMPTGFVHFASVG